MSNLYIPEDLFLLVLIRLPVKTAGRFKCVSKSWNLMISSSKFVQLHLQHQQYLQQSTSVKIKPPIRLLYDDGDGRSRRLGRKIGIETSMAEYYSIGRDEEIGCVIHRIYNSHESHSDGVTSFLVGSCNGLICQILTNQFDPDSEYYDCEISLCNPLTKSSYVLPKSPSFLRGDGVEGYGKVVVFSGFGYDDVHDTYKIFLASEHIYPYTFQSRDDPLYDFEVYTLRSGNWIRVRLDLDFRHDYHIETANTSSSNGVFINGALHWIIRTFRNRPHHNQNDHNQNDGILAFDLRADKYNLLQFPKDMKDENYNLTLSVVNGCLLLYEYHYTSPDFSFNMWIMKDYGLRDSWLKIHISNSEYPTILVSITPVGFIDDDNHTIKIIYHDGPLLLCYDTVTHQIVEFPAPSADTSHGKHIQFVPSLVEPRLMTMRAD